MAIAGGHVNEELLKRNEYIVAENEILRPRIACNVFLCAPSNEENENN